MDRDQYEKAFGMLRPNKESERRIHKRTTSYLRHTYPDIRFHTSLDGENMGQYQRTHVGYLQWGSGFPDLLIYKRTDQYCGLALEIKKDGESPYRKDGTLKSGQHFTNQEGWIRYLRANGWKAEFAVGYTHAIDLITDYLGNETKVQATDDGGTEIKFEDL